MKEIVFATTNRNKLKEISNYLPEICIKSLDMFENAIDVEETEDTFIGNALLKANSFWEQFGTPVLAEDSGIIIDCLKGKYDIPSIYSTKETQYPSIYSARFASLVKNNKKLDHDFNANNQLVLEELKNVENRTAKYVSVVVYKYGKGDDDYIVSIGELKGTIGTTEKGTNGFAYDTIFIPDNYTKTYAEMSTKLKNKLSHRTQAIEKIIPKIKNIPERN